MMTSSKRRAMIILLLLIFSSLSFEESQNSDCPPSMKCYYGPLCLLRVIGIGATAAYIVPRDVGGYTLGFIGFGSTSGMPNSLVNAASLFAALQFPEMAGISKTVVIELGAPFASAAAATCSCICARN